MLDLLKKFVSQNDPREYMRSPFNRGEWTYATNGHIAPDGKAHIQPLGKTDC